MSYYSTVGISMRKSDYIEMVRKAKQENRSAFDLLTKEADLYVGGNSFDGEELQSISLSYTAIKWYGTFDSVCWIENYIANKTKHGAVEIIIGENLEDNEESCYDGIEDSDAVDEAWACMQTIRDIQFFGTAIMPFEIDFGSLVTTNIDELI